MKQLLLIRHAKSDWNDASLSDFDRPLNNRGKTDAPVMAKRLLDKKVKIDLFISSPAKRAKKTASIFAKEYDIKKDKINFKEGHARCGLLFFWIRFIKTGKRTAGNT